MCAGNCDTAKTLEYTQLCQNYCLSLDSFTSHYLKVAILRFLHCTSSGKHPSHSGRGSCHSACTVLRDGFACSGLQSASWGHCGPPYRLWLLPLLELPDGFLGLLQLSTGLLALLFDCGQLPLDQVVLLCFLSSSHLSLGT